MAADHVSLADDGMDAAFPGSAPFDDEGVPRRRTPLIDRGVVVGVLSSTESVAANGDGRASTGNARRGSHKSPPSVAPTTLVLAATTTRTALLRTAPQLVYVQQLTFGRSAVDPVSGRIGVGAGGFLLNGGEPAGTYEPWALETRLTDLLRMVLDVGDDPRIDPESPTAAPTVACDPRLTSGAQTNAAG